MRTFRLIKPFVRGLRRLDLSLGRIGGHRTVLIEARTPMNLAVLRPVFGPLLQDGRLRVLFTGPPRDDLRAAARELGIARQVITREKAKWTRIDLYINADPWEAVTLRRCARQLNFSHGVAGKYDLDCPLGIPLGLERYDCVAFPNRTRRDAYVAAGLLAPRRAAVVGYPKVDALVNADRDRRGAAAVLGLDPSRPTAIFAPTFSPASALNTAGEAIVRALLDSGCNVIAKLHDRSRDPEVRYSGGIDWRAVFAAYRRGPFLLAEGADSTPYVLASDLMVTDHSSIGFEFLVLDRPLIVFDVPQLVDTARINPEKVALLRSAATVVRSAPELAAAVQEALARPAALSEERRHVAHEVFYQPGGASARALTLVYDLLNLRAAGAITAAGRAQAAPAA